MSRRHSIAFADGSNDIFRDERVMINKQPKGRRV